MTRKHPLSGEFKGPISLFPCVLPYGRQQPNRCPCKPVYALPGIRAAHSPTQGIPAQFGRVSKTVGSPKSIPVESPSPRNSDRIRQWQGSDFTHPRVGQAERLACRKRLPNAFLRAEARTHFSLTVSNASSPHLKNCATETKIKAFPTEQSSK